MKRITATPGSLKVGERAPDFTTTDSSGNTLTLAGERGHPVVLYFYPRDNTPGCTREACGFRDRWKEFTTKGARVLGVSTDSAKSHQKFIEKHHLPFVLLMDEDKAITEAYGAWGEKTFMGRKFMGTLRKTYLIDSKGRIARIWDKVKPDLHAEEVLEAIDALTPESPV